MSLALVELILHSNRIIESWQSWSLFLAYSQCIMEILIAAVNRSLEILNSFSSRRMPKLLYLIPYCHIATHLVLLLFFFLLGRPLSLNPIRLCRFKSDRDEIWHDCLWGEYASLDEVGFPIWRRAFKMATMTSFRRENPLVRRVTRVTSLARCMRYTATVADPRYVRTCVKLFVLEATTSLCKVWTDSTKVIRHTSVVE